MTAVRVGLDPFALEAISGSVRAQLDRLDAVRGTIDLISRGSVDPVGWLLSPGSVIVAPFSIASAYLALAQTRAVATAIEDLLARLTGEIAVQRDISAPSSSFLSTVTAASRSTALRIPLGGARARTGADWRRVRRAWARLSAIERAAIVTDHPERVASLDGVPFASRIEANRILAARRLSAGVDSEPQREYLMSVVEGDTQLLLFDPEGERIIEVIGDMHRAPEHVVTYVPGTGAEVANFYARETQLVAQSLVHSERDVATVALVYLDGPWVAWVGDRANTNTEYLADTGAALAHFSQVVAGEVMWRDAKHHVVSHSAGTTVAAYAEVNGATYSTFTSLAGSWLPAEWSARENSRYLYLQYGIDAINAITPLAWTPLESPDFERRILISSGVSINPGTNHSTVASGSDHVIGAIREFIR